MTVVHTLSPSLFTVAVTIGRESLHLVRLENREEVVRRVFSSWYLDKRAWIVAPLAMWMLAYLVVAVVTMIVQRRLV